MIDATIPLLAMIVTLLLFMLGLLWKLNETMVVMVEKLTSLTQLLNR